MKSTELLKSGAGSSRRRHRRRNCWISRQSDAAEGFLHLKKGRKLKEKSPKNAVKLSLEAIND